MFVDIEEFKQNTYKFIALAQKQEIIIKANDNLIKLVPVNKSEKENVSFVEKWGGAFKQAENVDLKSAKEERLSKYENID